MSEKDDGVLWPTGAAQIHGQRALLLWALSRDAHYAAATRAEFERLALLYERLAEHALREQSKVGTLVGLLSAKGTKWGRFEIEWVEWLQGVAKGDRRAFQTLYLWTHRFVFAFMQAVTQDKHAAEEATLGVFQDLWQRASTYDPTEDTVLSWIMNQARSRALKRQLFAHVGRRRSPKALRVSKEVLEAVREAREQNPSAVTGIESEPDLNEPGPGISCKVLATDVERSRLSMFVRLAPGGEYPPHTHAGIEQLYLLLGELWIDDRKIYPGGYNRSKPGTADKRVWSENGCACILVTSGSDILT